MIEESFMSFSPNGGGFHLGRRKPINTLDLLLFPLGAPFFTIGADGCAGQPRDGL
jgi:hypothetical protein